MLLQPNYKQLYCQFIASLYIVGIDCSIWMDVNCTMYSRVLIL